MRMAIYILGFNEEAADTIMNDINKYKFAAKGGTDAEFVIHDLDVLLSDLARREERKAKFSEAE
jgi:hypothetical protein